MPQYTFNGILPGGIRNLQLGTQKNNLAGAHPEKVAALPQRANELAQGAAKPLFLLEQMKVVMKNMQGQPVLPGEDDFESGDLS